MDTTYIQLDNEWAKMYVELKHGTSRRVQAIYEPFINNKDINEVIKNFNNGNTEEASTKLYELIGHNASLTATDIMILGQVESWSFGEINQETLDDMPERYREVLSKKCDELYSLPLAKSGERN